jgi:hypothetical protein
MKQKEDKELERNRGRKNLVVRFLAFGICKQKYQLREGNNKKRRQTSDLSCPNAMQVVDD